MHAIILAGGKGERLRPLTEDRPKGMVEVAGRPILAYQIAWLRHHGITDVTISCGYLAEVIQQFFGDGKNHGVKIRYAIEDEPLGTGGGFRYAMEAGEVEGPFVGTNGDIVTNVDLRALIHRHEQAHVLATVLLAPLQSPYGIADLDNQGLVLGFKEKPLLPYWLNAGIYMFDPAIHDQLPERGSYEEITFPKLAGAKQLLGFRTQAYWRAADTMKDVTELNKEMSGRSLDEFIASAPIEGG